MNGINPSKPNAKPKRRPKPGPDPLRSTMPLESVLFLMLSAADLLTTYRLLWHGRFYESNPIAQWFFVRWNFAGMTAFKFTMAAFIIVISEVIERKRPRVGRAILILGSVAAAYAALHGLRLEAEHG
jgi:hypothetical protein